MAFCWDCRKTFYPEDPGQRRCEHCLAQTELDPFLLEEEESPTTGGGKEKMNENRNNGSPEKPEKNIRCGAVRAAIWTRNRTRQDGSRFESKKVIIDRSYRDAAGRWQNTSALELNDIPKAILGLRKAYEWMLLGEGETNEIATEDVVF